MFPHDSAKRIVLVTDGNQNVGDALDQLMQQLMDELLRSLSPDGSTPAPDGSTDGQGGA